MAKKRKNCATNITQNSPSKGRQLDLFIHQGNLHKPQILSIPGVFPKQRDRYRVVLGDRILGARLTLDEAIALANQSTHL
jgi:hypothetical protein